MSFDSIEQSEYGNKPRELFWFMRGSDEWTFTSSADAVVFESKTFTPVDGITRSSIRGTNEKAKAQLTVTLPSDNEVAKQFVGIPDTQPMWLYIYRIHEGDSDYRLTWQGRVRFNEFQGLTSRLTLDNMLSSTKKGSLRHFFQNQCNHFTFDGNCPLSEAAYSHTATVASIADNNITAVDAQIAGYYIAGQVKRANGDRRFVVGNTKAGAVHTLNLLTPFEGLEVGETVTLIGGACSHTFDTCPDEAKPKYGGYPKVPRKNPFKSFH